jgi:hypothetical protein
MYQRGSSLRRIQLPGQVKLSFIQGFLNRLRNKASKVDLLSSGIGFVISAADLEDCANYLNKELFAFAEREFRTRMDTSAYVFD